MSDLVELCALPLQVVKAVLAYSRSEFGPKRSYVLEPPCIELTNS